MRQKIVIRVSMHCQKCHAKAMKIVVDMPGVESVALTGQEKNQLEVIGDGIDSVKLTRRLRKKVAHAEIVTIAEAKKVEQGKPNPAGGGGGGGGSSGGASGGGGGGSGGSAGAKPPGQTAGYNPPPQLPVPYYYYCDARQPYYGDGGCTIM